ncbi:GFA family protein [uncultured Erythrobacter sp.]|uniref:GFA family protein n=1 Tax=uncultured Erythrobacter sp. TaxID=263913 RepID=UPI0026092F4A|nr:GFA family protein [uncultured Erythrobacter sp.]
MSFTGGCQCGAVRYRIEADTLTCYACHCRECQKQSASAFGISVPVFAASLAIEGELGMWRRPTDSGSHTDCHFCLQCGTRLYHAGANRPGLVTVKGGSLDNASELAPVAHIWIKSRQDWVVLPKGVPHLETQPDNQEEWVQVLSGPE